MPVLPTSPTMPQSSTLARRSVRFGWRPRARTFHILYPIEEPVHSGILSHNQAPHLLLSSFDSSSSLAHCVAVIRMELPLHSSLFAEQPPRQGEEDGTAAALIVTSHQLEGASLYQFSDSETAHVTQGLWIFVGSFARSLFFFPTRQRWGCPIFRPHFSMLAGCYRN